MTFRVGDRVLCVNDVVDFGGLKKGQEYVIEAVFASGDMLPIAGKNHLWAYPGQISVWVTGGANFAAGVRSPQTGRLSPGYRPDRFRKVERKSDSLSIEAFLTIKPGFEEPKRTTAPAKKERV
jgi:hypothetical protein